MSNLNEIVRVEKRKEMNAFNVFHLLQTSFEAIKFILLLTAIMIYTNGLFQNILIGIFGGYYLSQFMTIALNRAKINIKEVGDASDSFDKACSKLNEDSQDKLNKINKERKEKIKEIKNPLKRHYKLLTYKQKMNVLTNDSVIDIPVFKSPNVNVDSSVGDWYKMLFYRKFASFLFSVFIGINTVLEILGTPNLIDINFAINFAVVGGTTIFALLSSGITTYFNSQKQYPKNVASKIKIINQIC